MAIKLSFEKQINTSAKVGDLVYFTNTNPSGGYDIADLDDLVLIGPILSINRRPMLNSLTKSFPNGISFDLGGYPWEDSNDIPLDTKEFLVFNNGVFVPEIDPLTSVVNYTYTAPVLDLSVISNINPIDIQILYTIDVDDSSFTAPVTPVLDSSSFIMFQKNEKFNTAGIKGYYAEVKFVNNSDEEVELFAISSEISQSSK